MKFVVCYDISNDRRLAKVSRFLEKHGIRVQYSIFEVETTHQGIKKLIAEIEKLINKDEDRVYAFPLENDKYKKVERIGKITSINII